MRNWLKSTATITKNVKWVYLVCAAAYILIEKSNLRCGTMGKRAAVILLFLDILVGLSLFCVCINKLAEPADAGVEGVVDEQRKIALTFDDGPHPYYTEQLLDGLKERGVVVTFFVTGEHAKLHPDVIKRMQEEGHLIGNHTYSHMQLTKSNREKFKEELIATNEVLKDITGEETEFVRPPYGSWDKSFEKELNMFPVLWTVDPLDWSSRNASRITEKIVNRVEENDIILMHDYYDTSVTAALQTVDELLEEGYTFVTVEEILFD